MKVPLWLRWLSIFIIAVTTLVIPLLLLESEADQWVADLVAWADSEPLLTASILIVTLTSDVLFPVPNGIINTVAGSLFGWFWGAVVIWLGLSIGALVGYGVGASAGSRIARRIVGSEDLKTAEELAERMGAATLVITRTVPMFGDIATIAAGITSYPFRKYCLVIALANFGVALVYAGLGATASETESGLLAFFSAIVLPLAAWGLYRVFGNKVDSEAENERNV